MNEEILFGLLTNIILLMSLTIVYSLFSHEKRISYVYSKLIMGVSVSIIGYIIMRNSVVVSPGIMFDGRTVLMLITGMYFGAIPVLIGSITLSSYRIALGGNGVIPGVMWVIIPGLIGLTWRYFRIKRNKIDISEISYTEQYLLILVNQIIVVGILFLFPNKVPLEAINKVALPLVLLYPIGGLIASVFTLKQRRAYFQSLIIKQRESELNVLFNGGTNYSFIVDQETDKIIKVNQVAIDKYGYSFDEFTKLTIHDINLSSRNQLQEIKRKKSKNGYEYVRLKHVLKNGENIDVDERSVPIDIDGVTYTYSTVTDVTSRLEDEKKYQNINKKLSATLHNVSDGIIVTDEYGSIDIINKIGEAYLALPNENIVGKKITDIIRIYSDDQKTDLKSIYNDVVSENKSFKSESPYVLLTNEDDKSIYIHFSLSPITYDDGYHKGSILVLRDVTQDYEKTNEIKYVSQHDFLTGLYNRYFLEVELRRLDTKRQLPISIILGDANGLKLVNDSFGHIEGDNLLKEIAQIIRKSTRSEDIIARWGGDEFIILLPQTSRENAEKVRSRINDLSKKSMYEVITPSLSLGIATKTKEQEEINGVLIEAEKEMYFNKQEDGKKMRTELLRNLEIKLNNLHPELGIHSQNLIELAKEFGSYLNLERDELETLIKFAKYHDIGWVAINKSLFLKNHNLEPQDFDKISIHPQVGFRIMKSIPEFSQLAELIHTHHEKWNGKGYPEGLKEKEIPYLSRILPIIDAYDIMTANSDYSDQISSKEALQKINANAGTEFDPELCKKFITMHKKTI